MTVQANSHDQASQKLKNMMNASTIAAHIRDRHPGEPIMSVDECHRMIDEQVVAV